MNMSQDTTAGASAHIELRGADFAYTDVGSGPLVLDAHGLTSSRANNRRMEFPASLPLPPPDDD